MGESHLFDPEIRSDPIAQLFLRVVGRLDTSSSAVHFIRYIQQIATVRPLRRVLDAGCGKGKLSFWLAGAYPHAQLDALDYSSEKIAASSAIQRDMGVTNIRFFVADLCHFSNESAYDLIFSNHVLEHIVENRKVLANLVQSLRPGGFIYIQMPNAVQQRLPVGRRFLASYDEWERGEHAGQTLTLDALSTELRQLGCRIVDARYTEGWVGELRFELEQMALGHFRNKVLYAALYPLLRTLGYVDSLFRYQSGNGVLVLAQRME
jgi:2-polyprenyl-3-methyl-5-hydroxy-6-metoxy-1,4-benzoquinol methylase